MTAKRRRLSRAECVNQEDREETPAQILRGAILRFFGRFDLMQIIPLALLLTVGMLFVHSTGQQVGGHHVELFSRHCVYLSIGVALWFLFILIDYRWIGLFSTLFYPAVIIVLILVLAIGPLRNNTKRWIDIGPVSIQPSEFGKMAVLFSTAWLASLKRVDVNRIQWIALIVALTVVPFLLLYKEPDLGTAIVLIPLTAAILFAANLRWIYIALIVVMVGVSVPVVYMNMKTYQKERIRTFTNPEHDPFGRGWNAIQSEIAIGTGGMTGKGYRNGTKVRPAIRAIHWFLFTSTRLSEASQAVMKSTAILPNSDGWMLTGPKSIHRFVLFRRGAITNTRPRTMITAR